MSHASLKNTSMAIVDSLPVALLIVDKTGFIQYHNKAADNIYSRFFSASGKHNILTNAVNKNNFRQVINQLEQSSATPQVSLKLTYTQSCQQLALSISIHPEQKNFYLISLNPLNSQFQLQKNFKELKQFSRLSAMREISSSLADRLNQPLTAILSYSQAMQRLYQQDASSEEIAHAMQRVVVNAESAGQIIKDIRAKLKVNYLHYQHTGINQLIQESIHLTELDSPASKIKLTTHYEAECVSLCIDAVQIKQVILNLLNNAIDALADINSDTAEIIVRTQKLDAHYTISISDNGSGLAAEIQSHLFEAFSSTRKNGIGIGLSISQHIIDLHNGHIKINSVTNNNSKTSVTTVNITLPLEDTACNEMHNQ